MSLNRRDLRIRPSNLQHRHFAAIAAAMRDSKPTNENKLAQWQSTINSFIVICRSANPRFNAERFIAACNHE